MIILSDLDGVGADWDGHHDLIAQSPKYAHLPIPLLPERTSFAFYDTVDAETREAILEIMNLPTFYADLKAFPGWVDAMHRLDAMGHKVFIVSTPWWDNQDCTRDKLNWVAEHLGEEWRKRVILTGDKTVVHGDILIDDKPNIHGIIEPYWKQVLFDRPFNRSLDLPRISDWTDWNQVEEALGLA